MKRFIRVIHDVDTVDLSFYLGVDFSAFGFGVSQLLLNDVRQALELHLKLGYSLLSII